MTEIKLTDSFSSEVAAFRASAEDLDSASLISISKGNLSLPTADAYMERLNEIWKMMIRFNLLVKKDADDMDALAAKLKAADTNSN